MSIDGACKSFGKPDCVVAGGVVVRTGGEYKFLHRSERQSTSQRAELLALLAALEYLRDYAPEEDALIITDSEYLFNTITKEWYNSWIGNNWITSTGTPVKNVDIIKQIIEIYELKKDVVAMVYIKGHVVADGGNTTMCLLYSDPAALQEYYENKAKTVALEYVKEVFKKNNGYEPDEPLLRELVALNMMADRHAVKCCRDAYVNN